MIHISAFMQRHSRKKFSFYQAIYLFVFVSSPVHPPGPRVFWPRLPVSFCVSNIQFFSSQFRMMNHTQNRFPFHFAASEIFQNTPNAGLRNIFCIVYYIAFPSTFASFSFLFSVLFFLLLLPFLSPLLYFIIFCFGKTHEFSAKYFSCKLLFLAR